MKHNISSLLMLLAAVGALSATPVMADNETQDVEIKIVAPLDAADCGATPPTITVLGLVIDVSGAAIEVQSSAPAASPSPTPAATPQAGDDGNHGHGARPVGGVPPTAGCYYSCSTPVPVSPPASTQQTAGNCSTLVVGQSVEVRLASDSTPLAAAEVKQGGGESDVEVQAPLQGIDTGAQTITVIGLVVDASGAGVDGSDDGDQSSQPIDLTQLILGQIVDVKLAGNQPPLAASELNVKNFTNQVELDMQDAGGEIDDVDANGNPTDDVTVDIVDTTAVTNPGPSTGTTTVRKQVRLHVASNGSITIGGLPTGAAKFSVIRVHNGVTSVGRRGVRVLGNTTRSVRVRLHHVRSH